MQKILGVNVDHIATLRNARNESYPDLIALTRIAQKAGANQITAHLREDRRHIKDQDMLDLKKHISLPLNMEMALTEEMFEFSINLSPNSVCLVPEKRNEVTTEGGLDVIANYNLLEQKIRLFQNRNILVSLFLDADMDQIKAGIDLKCNSIEINTGSYANAIEKQPILNNISNVAKHIVANNVKVHAGHGLNLDNIDNITKIDEISEFNIGHFLVSYALFVGLEKSVSTMKEKISKSTN